MSLIVNAVAGLVLTAVTITLLNIFVGEPPLIPITTSRIHTNQQGEKP